ncbi:MAG TPA: ABC transporter permease [Elusimicrobiota bacterium]|nr:ABC transporter permease [Elusimicrobiota bacterium]
MTTSHQLGLLGMVRRSLRQHALSTAVTVISTAMASGLAMAVFGISQQAYDAFTGGQTGFDAVLGARGSALQLVLNTVFHLETSPGNIPWSLYQAIARDPRVRLAVPYAVGDNYHGYRIVGTTEELFTQFEYQKGKHFHVHPGERFFDPEKKEAVIGSYVAQKTSLRTGSIFHPYHGLDYDPAMRHDEEYVVTGVLEPTNSPSDRVIWIPIEGIYRMSGHVLRGAGREYSAQQGVPIPDADKEVSAVMLKFHSPQAGFMLDQTINKQGKVATLAWPIAMVMAELFNKIGWVNKILTLVAYLVMVVAGASILASIYNSINERRRDFAILRALGARRRTLFAVILGEAFAMSALGSLGGYGVYAILIGVASVIVRAQTGVVLDVLHWDLALVFVPIGMIGIGCIAGIIPAMKGYKTDVAENLTPIS